MASINTGRMVLGGGVSGLVANVCDRPWEMPVRTDDRAANTQKCGGIQPR
jgi:hypothetical protein